MIIPEAIQRVIFDFFFHMIEDQMIFDPEIVDTNMFEIINKYKVTRIKNPRVYGISCKLKYGIPVNTKLFKSISWKVCINVKTFPNAIHFIGVVSNRTKEFDTSPFSPSRLLKDSYGISGNDGSILHAAKAVSHKAVFGNYLTHGYVQKQGFGQYTGYVPDNWVTVKYIVAESKLVYTGLKHGIKFELPLPTDIEEITHWYPAFTLRDVGDIYDIIVK